MFEDSSLGVKPPVTKQAMYRHARLVLRQMEQLRQELHGSVGAEFSEGLLDILVLHFDLVTRSQPSCPQHFSVQTRERFSDAYEC
jgi:hypothetical protein